VFVTTLIQQKVRAFVSLCVRACVRARARVFLHVCTTLIPQKFFQRQESSVSPVLAALQHDIDAFCTQFSSIREASELLKQLRKLPQDAAKN
jgi:hypothetical protein